jgi:hypothetical protein
MHKTNRIIYRGASRINGQPIVVVAVVGKRASIVIQAHGSSATMAAVRRIDALQVA